ncbi:hypothetical protein BGZ83_003807, partial [Gryganskiella cystojenkinii]
ARGIRHGYCSIACAEASGETVRSRGNQRPQRVESLGKIPTAVDLDVQAYGRGLYVCSVKKSKLQRFQTKMARLFCIQSSDSDSDGSSDMTRVSEGSVVYNDNFVEK